MVRLLSISSAIIVILALQAQSAEKRTLEELAQICAPFHLDPKASTPLSEDIEPRGTAKTCTFRTSHGFQIPDPACTPGAINPTLTDAVLHDKSFLTECLRNDATSEAKKETTYATYEGDVRLHIVPGFFHQQREARHCVDVVIHHQDP